MYVCHVICHILQYLRLKTELADVFGDAVLVVGLNKIII
mgnify:FL=1